MRYIATLCLMLALSGCGERQGARLSGSDSAWRSIYQFGRGDGWYSEGQPIIYEGSDSQGNQ